MPTIKQEKAVAKIVENRGTSIGQAMREAGYSPNSAKNPKNLTDSIGYQEVLDKYGLTEELIITALVEDIENKPQNRKPELELGAKMRGMIINKQDITSDGEQLTSIQVSVVNSNADKS